MIETLQTLLERLHAASCFEDAAGVLLDAIRDRVAHTELVPVRGMVHHRPAGSYEGLFVREFDGQRAGTTEARHGQLPRILPSLTAWHQVSERGFAVLMDVAAETVCDAEGNQLQAIDHTRADFRSRDVLLSRRVTHIAAFPLRRSRGHIDGFVSVELMVEHDPSAWPAVVPALQLMVDCAAAFVSGLPRAARPEVMSDPLLPVIGAVMRPRIEDLQVFAATDETLLLYGDTGVGKSRLAKWCWSQSARASRAFVTVNLAAENENLREGALFGWVRGAFSGAVEPRTGLVESAEGGTLFIDEIDKLSARGQAMLLSLLDDGQYRVIGTNESRHADVRFIVGTNADLDEEVAQGRFLKDLYYRIRVMPVRIPPLRQRRDEIVPWAEHLIGSLHDKADAGGTVRLASAAGALLERQDWPGNLRQLHSVVKRAHAFASRHGLDEGGGTVDVAHVERALVYERASKPSALWTAMQQAATAFVDAALLREDGLHIDHAKAFTGLVLNEAVARLGEREAFVALGREASLKSSNHLKKLRQEQAAVDTLGAALGEPRGTR